MIPIMLPNEKEKQNSEVFIEVRNYVNKWWMRRLIQQPTDEDQIDSYFPSKNCFINGNSKSLHKWDVNIKSFVKWIYLEIESFKRRANVKDRVKVYRCRENYVNYFFNVVFYKICGKLYEVLVEGSIILNITFNKVN